MLSNLEINRRVWVGCVQVLYAILYTKLQHSWILVFIGGGGCSGNSSLVDTMETL